MTFLLWFGILREENDLDEELGKSLYSRIDGLEEQHLQQYIKYCYQNNIPCASHEQRLVQLLKEREARSQESAN